MSRIRAPITAVVALATMSVAAAQATAPPAGFAPGPAIDIDVAPDDARLRELRIELPFMR